MRFIKRLIFVIILLVIAFFIYRLINPKAANALLHDMKSFSNQRIGTHFSLSGTIITITGDVINTTGVVIEQTGGLQEITGNDELLLNDSDSSQENLDTGSITTGTDTTGIVVPCPAMSTIDSCPTGQEKYITYSSSSCGTYYACRTKPTSTSSSTSNGSSSSNTLRQAAKDLKNLFGN